jgi:hypothetical protein
MIRQTSVSIGRPATAPCHRKVANRGERRIGCQCMRPFDFVKLHSAPPSDRTIRDFRRMLTCAERMTELLQDCGGMAVHRSDYRRLARLHQRIYDRIALDNLDLVYLLYRGTVMDRAGSEDLLNDGLKALTRAIDTFDPWRGVQFSSYACSFIIRAFYRFAQRETRGCQHDLIDLEGGPDPMSLGGPFHDGNSHRCA